MRIFADIYIPVLDSREPEIVRAMPLCVINEEKLEDTNWPTISIVHWHSCFCLRTTLVELRIKECKCRWFMLSNLHHCKEEEDL
ncbi:hypothetical protein CEXT_21481 [Caerostris extrusa]|uniref:Uncharacterized protein n=1 Tax=Caerostris extrusa TaxID=172846 RepID=A0AAV4RIK6_CAEEX|nr:hypothetical protein CEXT_21481 [Caerostris extrusa]